MQELWEKVKPKIKAFNKKATPIVKGIHFTNDAVSIDPALMSPETMAMTLVIHEVNECVDLLQKNPTLGNMRKLDKMLDKFLAMKMGEPLIQKSKGG